MGGSVAEWLACWTQAHGFKSQVTVLSANYSNPSCLCSPSSKIGSSFLRVAGVTAGLAESNGSLPPGLWLTSPAGWLPRTGISSGTLCSVIEYRLPLPCFTWTVTDNKCHQQWIIPWQAGESFTILAHKVGCQHWLNFTCSARWSTTM